MGTAVRGQPAPRQVRLCGGLTLRVRATECTLGVAISKYRKISIIFPCLT